MKALLVLVLVATISASEIDFYPTLEEGPTALDFFRGLLKGIGEPKPVDDLITCAKDVEVVIHKVHEALLLIKTLRPDNVVKGVQMLIAAVNELFAILKPCVTGYEVVQKLILAVFHADPNIITQKILKNTFMIIGWITNAISCFQSKQFECVGSNVGQFLKMLFLDPLTASKADIIAFLKGFFEGIGGTVNIDDILVCVKDIEYILQGIKKAFEAIKTKNILKIIEGLKELFHVVKKFFDDLKPCAQNVEAFKRLVEALAKADIKKIAAKILTHIGAVIEIVTHTLSCIHSRDFHCIGKGLGSFLKLILL